MAKPFTSSASQISTYELCPRKWAWKYIEGLKPPPNKWAAFGTRVHKVLEQWFRSRLPPDINTREGKVAQAMIPHLPPPQQVHPDDVELKIDLQLGGVPFVGYVDLFTRSDGVPTVHDHKTTSDLVWALRADRMHEDIQATTYAYWGMQKTNAQVVRAHWTYGTTKGKPRALPVIRDLHVDDIRERVERTAQSAHETKLIKLSGARALDVPYDAAGCEAYGGCPFKERCGLTPQERIESVMSHGAEKNNFLAKLEARKKAAASGGNGAPQTHPPAINPPEPPAPEPAPEPPAPTPEAKPSEPAKKKTRKKRKTKAEKEAEAAAAAQAAQSASESPAPPPAQPPPVPENVPHAGVGSPGAANMLQVLNAQYRAGFQDGFNAGLKHRG